MKVLLKNGESIFYEKREGGDLILLLIHGNMASSVQWDLLIEHMDSKYTVYAIDLRGYGQSSYQQPINSIRDFADDIKLFAEQLDIKKADVIGWSNGGGVAMQFAATYPDYVNKLILLASMSTRGYPALDEKNNRVHSREAINNTPSIRMLLDAQENENTELFKGAMNHLLYSVNKPSEKRYEKYLRSAIQQRNIADAAHAANIFNISAQSNGLVEGTGEIKHINMPILIIWGLNDQLTSQQMTLEIIKDLTLAGKPFKYVPINAGHALLVDNLNAVLDEINNFLR
ncbi:alpha/beta fold hydrolase [Alkalihalobacillus pseudalcaliphilus]|uniref:intracellular short-chain-length polyhydroxyalkanoate depolymerase n=1 Tax=Alkalihalobacillus pseudalcaliphilus TaxID=79884 RepID=UPI00069D5732|nr:alpha/beta hydrolase [Alkalihalobacillus pseudalcaliphilus]